MTGVEAAVKAVAKRRSVPAAKPCPRGAVECRREAAVKAVAKRRSVPAAKPCPRGAVECRREAAVKAVKAVEAVAEQSAERRSAWAQQILLDSFGEGVHALTFRIGEFGRRSEMFNRRDYKQPTFVTELMKNPFRGVTLAEAVAFYQYEPASVG